MSAQDIMGVLSGDQDRKELEDLEEKILRLQDPGAVVRAHREELEILEDLQTVTKGLSGVFDSSVHDREPLERAYAMQIDILFRLARRFHPLSEYGIETMEKAVACRKDFEELAGPLVTRITAGNISRFSSLMDEDLAEEIAVGKSYGIGVLRSSGNDVYAAGAAVFYADTAGLDEEKILRVKWLYVDKEWRERGVANELVGELIYLVSQGEYAAMTADFYGDDSAEIYGNLFTEWHFRFTDGLSPEYAFSLSDVGKQRDFEVYEDKATSLLELPDREEENLVRDYLLKGGYQGYLKREDLPKDYIETELSCFVGTRTKPKGLALMHRCPSGRITAEYLDSGEPDEDRMEEMVGAMALTASYKYDRNSEVVLGEQMIRDREALYEMFSRQKAQYIIEAVLVPPYASFTAEDVTRIIEEQEQEEKV